MLDRKVEQLKLYKVYIILKEWEQLQLISTDTEVASDDELTKRNPLLLYLALLFPNHAGIICLALYICCDSFFSKVKIIRSKMILTRNNHKKHRPCRKDVVKVQTSIPGLNTYRAFRPRLKHLPQA